MSDGLYCPNCGRYALVSNIISVVGSVGETFYECPQCGVTSHDNNWEAE